MALPTLDPIPSDTPAMPRWLVRVFAAAAGLSVANVYYAQPLLDALARDFRMTEAAVGLVVTATQVGCALALLLVVPLGDLLDRRRLVRVQSVCLVLALAAVAVAPGRMTLLAGMGAVGLLGTAMTQGLIAYAASLAAPAERGSVVGAAQGGVVIGLLLARSLSGLVADVAGWRAVYGTAAVLAVAMGVALHRALPARHAPAAAPRLAYPTLIGSTFTLIAQDRVLRTRGMLALLMFAAFNIFWTPLALPLSAPPYALSHTQIGAFGLVGALGALAAARAGQWADRGLGQRTTGLALGAMLLSWLLLAGTSQSLWWLAAGIVLLDLGGQAIHVTNQGMIFRSAGAHSRMVAGYMLFYAVGSGLGAMASTAMYAAAGWTGVCALGAGVTLLAAAFWAFTLSRRDRSVAQTTEHAVRCASCKVGP
jgi:predicted MFS family arabinose efflux permease